MHAHPNLRRTGAIPATCLIRHARAGKGGVYLSDWIIRVLYADAVLSLTSAYVQRLLKPHCGHTCVMLCHPGACPPCPHTVKDAPCHCGKEALMKRCGDKHWSCSKPCNKLLSCGTHRCKQICHDGKCLECPQTSMQSCTCGKESKIVACAAPAWSCSKPCGKLFGCGQLQHPPPKETKGARRYRSI